MSETCPKCGAKDNGGSEYDCGTPFGAKVLQSDRCRIRELEQTVEAFEGMKEGAAEVAIEALQNARERTDNYEDDLEYERAIDGLKACLKSVEAQDDRHPQQ